MKEKIIIWLIILAIIFFPQIGSIFTEEGDSWNDYARIVDMDYKAVVVDEPNCEGKIAVTERFTFDVHAASKDNGFWELWRDLCEDYIDGLRVYYDVKSVKQILPNGEEVVWQESDKLYWDDWDYVKANKQYGPEKWYHSEGPYDEYYDRYECVFFYVNDLYREQITFEIEYEMYNAVLRYGDCSDLYIAMYSGETIEHLKNIDVEILIPNKDMPSAGNYRATTYGTNAASFPFEESSTKNPGYYTFSFSLDEDELKFKPYNQYIEFDLVAFGEDKHIFADYASRNLYYEDEALQEILDEQEYYETAPTRYKAIKLGVLGICLLISLIVAISEISKISKLKAKCPVDSGNFDTFRDIPSDLDPKLAASLVFCKDKKSEDDAGVYSALLLSLARKEYITLEEYAYDDAIITIKELEQPMVLTESTQESIDFAENKYDWIEENNEAPLFQPIIEPIVDTREPLTTCEELYLNLLKRHAKNNSIKMSEFQNRIEDDYDNTHRFKLNVDASVVNDGINLRYFQKAKYLNPKIILQSEGTTLMIFGFIILTLVNWLSSRFPLDFAFGGYTILAAVCLGFGIYFKKQAHKYVLLTDEGQIEYEKWRGLYNFLKSDTLINERTYIELPLWEKYLVYATAFGISEKVIEAIKIRCPEGFERTESIVHNNYCCSSRFRSSGRSFHSSVRTASYSHSSGGYGGGYGGGGRGGGGGGGGH